MRKLFTSTNISFFFFFFEYIYSNGENEKNWQKESQGCLKSKWSRKKERKKEKLKNQYQDRKAAKKTFSLKTLVVFHTQKLSLCII